MKKQPTASQSRALSRILKVVFTTGLLPALVLIVTTEFSLAGSGTWQEDPNSGDGDWNFFDADIGSNWSPNGAIPNGSDDTATFATSSITNVFLSANTEVNGIVFTPGASAFTISTFGAILTISGAGITNNSAATQQLVTSGGMMEFTNSATASNATITNSQGMVSFNDNSTAANATITNTSGIVDFYLDSTAANATIINSLFGNLHFWDNSTAANATITNATTDGTIAPSSISFNNNSTAANATITNSDESHVQFFDNSTAANATIINLDFGSVQFFSNSTAANATIINLDSGSVQFFGNSTAANAMIANSGGDILGGTTMFQDRSTAGNATLIANGGSDGGLGGTILFKDDSTGGTARVEVFGNGTLDISLHNASSVTIGSIEGDGNVLLGTNDLTVGSNNLTTAFSGVIEGNGGVLAKEGTGTLTLLGTNTYTGDTTVSTGILNIQNDSALGATTRGTVVLGFATLQLQGDISVGAETLLIEGAGGTGQNGALVNVSGTNNYGGLLTLGADSTISSDSGMLNLTNSGTITGTEASPFNLTLTGAGNGAISSIIGTGTGSLTKSGAGTWTLNRANTYTGLTTVTAGTLAEGVSNAISTGDLTIDGATAIFDLGANHGDSVGTVTLDGGGSITGTGTSTLTSTVSFEMKSGTVSTMLRGSVALNKTTTGTVTLTGANTYTGVTTVNEGSLFVDGSIASGETLVNSGGLLGGGLPGRAGSLAGSVTNSGIVSPGHSPGTLTIGGNYTQTAGGTLQIEVAGLGAADHDLLAVNGTATLAGTLQIIRLNNFQFHVGDHITFLTADGGVSGTFNPVENPFVLSSVNYSAPNGVTLEVLAVAPPPLYTSIFNIGVSLANIQTANLERRMEDIRAGSRGFSASGFAIHVGTPNFSGGLAGPTGPEGKSGQSVFQPIPENRWGVFVTGLGEFTNVGDTTNAHGFDLTTGGLTFGLDYRVCPNFAIGLTGSYAHTNTELGDTGNLEVNGGTLGLYATAFEGGFYVNTAVTGGFDSYDTDRSGLLGIAHGTTDGAEFNALVSSGYDWKIGELSIGPVASFQYTYVDFNGFTESGSVAPLNFTSQNAESIRTSVGLKASYDWKVGSILFRPEIRTTWQHEFGDNQYSIVSRLASGAGDTFTVNGSAIGRDSLLVGAGVAILWNDRVSTYAYYDGELARANYLSNNVSVGVRINF